MAITDELREWWVRRFPIMDKELHEDFTAITKRIDKQHAEAQRRWMAELDAAREQSFRAGFDDGFASADDWLAQHEDAMREHGWVKLPKDADGEPIRIGDRVTEHEDGHTFKVDGFMDWDGEWWVFMRDGIQAPASRCTHYRTPTVEDVLTEFGIDWEHESDCEDKAALLTEYAKRLKLAGEGE